MDNNNNLPYGAIAGDNESLFSGGRAQISPWNIPGQTIPRFFSPIDLARNVNLDVTGGREMAYTRPWATTGGEGLGQSTAPLGIRDGQPVITHAPYIDSQPVTINGASNSLINQQLISDRTGVNNIQQNSITGLFRSPWSQNGVQLGNVQNYTESMPSNPSVMAAISAPVSLDTTTRIHAQPSKYPSARVKRKVSSDGTELEEPSPKQLITEEKMAAKMHNLKISGDHSYSSNGLSLMGWNQIGRDGLTSSTAILENSEGEKQDDNDETMSEGPAAFSLAPGMKEALGRSTRLLPQAILDHINKPCLAIIPWKPPDVLLQKFNFPTTQNRTDDEKAEDNDNCKNEEIIINQSELGTGVDHVEVVGDASDTFDFDDMDI